MIAMLVQSFPRCQPFALNWEITLVVWSLSAPEGVDGRLCSTSPAQHLRGKACGVCEGLRTSTNRLRRVLRRLGSVVTSDYVFLPPLLQER